MSRRQYIIIAALVFTASLIVQAPAATLYGWFKPKSASAVEVLGLQGSIGDGHAASLIIDNRPVLSNLHWTLQAWRLLLGQLSFHLESSGDSAMDGRVALTPLGSVHVDKLRANAGAKALLTAIGQPFLPLDGQASLQLNALRLHGKPIMSADGRVEVHGLAWTLAQEPIELGDFAAIITTENDVIVAKLQPLSGPLDISGSARLSPDQRYDAQIQLRPKPGAPALLNSMLSSIGPADAQGWHHIHQQGQLQ